MCPVIFAKIAAVMAAVALGVPGAETTLAWLLTVGAALGCF